MSSKGLQIWGTQFYSYPTLLYHLFLFLLLFTYLLLSWLTQKHRWTIICHLYLMLYQVYSINLGPECPEPWSQVKIPLWFTNNVFPVLCSIQLYNWVIMFKFLKKFHLFEQKFTNQCPHFNTKCSNLSMPNNTCYILGSYCYLLLLFTISFFVHLFSWFFLRQVFM